MITDVYADRKKQKIMQDTFGHLAPKKGRSYKGFMIYAHGEYGEIVLLDAKFKGLSDSPWLFDAMQDYIGGHCKDCGVYKWEGRCTKIDESSICFGGEIKRIEFEELAAVFLKI